MLFDQFRIFNVIERRRKCNSHQKDSGSIAAYSPFTVVNVELVVGSTY